MPDVNAVLVPQMNANDEHAVIVRWHVTPGTWVEEGGEIATLETSKATFELTVSRAGFVFYDKMPLQTVACGTTVAWISDTNEPVRQVLERGQSDIAHDVSDASDAGHRFTRKALKRMRELGLSAQDFETDDLIDTAAVDRRARERRRSRPAEETPDSRTETLVDSEPLEQHASKIFEVRMLTDVHRQVVPSTVCTSVSCRDLDQRLKDLAEEGTAGSPSLLELSIYEVSRLLSEFPELNSFYSSDRAWKHTGINVGFAMNLGRGLRVPVVKAANRLSRIEVCRAVRDLSLRYMRNELSAEQMTGGTFTVTDLSAAGVHHFIPVLHAHQSAILGICAERPVVAHRDFVLTFDHRLSDGMQAGAFLGRLGQRLVRRQI